MSSSENKEADA